MIEDFALVVKQDYVMEKFYFNFFDMPDLIVKMNLKLIIEPGRSMVGNTTVFVNKVKDYELVIKMLKKVKK